MSDLFWLSEAQLRRIQPFFPLSHGIPRVDDRRVISGIIFVIRNGLRWRDAPAAYGPPKTLYNRFVRWSRLGVFDRIFAGLAGRAGRPDCVMIDSTHLKAHRTAASLWKKGLFPAVSAAPREGRAELEAARCLRWQRRPIVLLLSEGQMSDHKGARLLFDSLPQTKKLIADRGYDSDRFRVALAARGTTPCIPPRKNRKLPHTYDATLYRQRHRRTGAGSPCDTIDAHTPS
jgi:transposase